MRKVLTAVMCGAVVMAFSGAAFAQDHQESEQVKLAKANAPVGKSNSYLGFALGLGLAIAAFGGAAGQSKAISAAVEAVARQPEAGGRIQTMMIIGLALIETLVIYMLLICFMWGGKV